MALNIASHLYFQKYNISVTKKKYSIGQSLLDIVCFLYNFDQ